MLSFCFVKFDIALRAKTFILFKSILGYCCVILCPVCYEHPLDRKKNEMFVHYKYLQYY